MRIRSFSFIALLAAAGCVADPPGPSVPAEETFAASLGVDIPSMVKISDDLYYKDITVGTGSPTATYGSTITVFYSGFLKDGTLFDTNVGGDSLVYPLTDATFIAGWTVGIPGMKPGGVRKLVVGSAYAYGARGQEAPAGRVSIPPNATLVFDIQLKAVK